MNRAPEEDKERAQTGAGNPDRAGNGSCTAADFNTQAEALRSEFERRFGDGAFSNASFLEAFADLSKARDLFPVLSAVDAGGSSSGPTSGEEFEARYRAALSSLKAGSHPPPGSPPLDFFAYLSRALKRVGIENGRGGGPDEERTSLLLRAGTELLEDAVLSGFRVDLFTRFPTMPLGSAPSVVFAEDVAQELTAKPEKDLVGFKFGQYEVLRLLGVGGFSEVFLARHTKLEVLRALKVIRNVPLSGTEHDRVYEAFIGEARLQAALDHPNVVRMLEVADHEGRVGLIMDFVDGKNLAEIIHERRVAGTHLSPHEILDIAVPIAAALVCAHARGLVHRDIKPENILIDKDGRVRIADFGLARTFEQTGQKRLVQTGFLTGTPHYMAPEQTGSRTYDQRCDYYSLGAVLYHMALGEPPYDAGDPWTILRKHHETQPVPLTELVEGFPQGLNALILKCLEKHPEDRFASATELLQALESSRAELGAEAERPASGWRRSILAGTAAGTLFLLASMGYVAWKSRTKDAGATPIGRVTPDDGPVGAPKPSSAAPSPEEKKKGETASVPENDPSRNPASPARTTASGEKEEKAPQLSIIPLRDRLRTHVATSAEVTFITEMLDLFSRRRPEALSRSYKNLSRDLAALDPGPVPAKEEASPTRIVDYASSHWRAAQDIVRLAEGAVTSRWTTIVRPDAEVALTLVDGSRVSGRVVEGRPDAVVIRDEKGGITTVEFTRVAPVEFVKDDGVPDHRLAYQALSCDSLKALLEVLGLEESSPRFTPWIPVLVRFARLEVEDLLEEVAREAGDVLPASPAGEPAPKLASSRDHSLAAVRAIAESEARVTALYAYLESEFKAITREEAALQALLDRRYSHVLAGYEGTRAFPVAASLLFRRFEEVLAGHQVEVMTGPGFFNFDWKLLPKLGNGESSIDYVDRDADRDLIVLRSPDGKPRSFVMNGHAPRAPEGVLLRLRFEPIASLDESRRWKFELLREGRGSNYLSFDERSVAFYRASFSPEGADELVASTPLPGLAKDQEFRTFVLLPGESGFLHLLGDGKVLLNLPLKEASIPRQLSFVVVHGKLTFQNVRVRSAGK